MLCLGPNKSLSSPRLKLMAQGMAQYTDVQSRVWYHSAIQAPPLSVNELKPRKCQLAIYLNACLRMRFCWTHWSIASCCAISAGMDHSLYKKLCFFKIGYSRPLFCLFLSFQTNFTILTTNKCEKCPSSIRCSAVFVAQLVERSLPKAEISGSNPVIGTFYLL